MLDSKFCPAFLPLPLEPWGCRSPYKAKQRGNWHFYVVDEKFQALWKDPDKLLVSRPEIVVEPNFSLPPNCDKAVALFQIYRKRLLARYWQSKGIFIFVDMNVHKECLGS